MRSKLIAYFKKVHESVAVISASNLKYEIERLSHCQEEFFKRCAPCEVGDRVVIIRDLNISPDSGWSGSKHFLVIGAKGVATEVDFFGGQFRVDIIFDDESWKAFDGVITKTEPGHRHTFCMGEKDIKKLD